MKKYIYLNLKRFDVPASLGGVNRLGPVAGWSEATLAGIPQALRAYAPEDVAFTFFFPEAHLLAAAKALDGFDGIRLGCQGVYRQDVSPGGNFGAFTSHRPAAAAKALGCQCTLIGHYEERLDKMGILAEAGVASTDAINRLLNQEIHCALHQGLSVLYCIGERSQEQESWQEVLARQLSVGLDGIGLDNLVIAYEPIWAIGPGKKPADRNHIQKIAKFVKAWNPKARIVYGGGMKADNAEMLSSIPELDGGLIALTRFSGDIGFYPEEYLDIVKRYLGK